jgi:hypothetical protein
MYRKKKLVVNKQVIDEHQSFSSNMHKFDVKIAIFYCYCSFLPSVSESFSSLDARLNWIPASGLVTSAIERGVFVYLTLSSL